MKHCKICGLGEDYTNIRFNDDGVCNYCEFYEAHKDMLEDTEQLEQAFRQKMEHAKAKARAAGADYDCLVGFSGGKDSTYIIYQLKETYGMYWLLPLITAFQPNTAETTLKMPSPSCM
jgi:tRNA(Ile)-lysidine synthase TilS/MesJ